VKKWAASFVLIAALGLQLAWAGTHPRPSAFDYRVQGTSGDVTVGAEIVPSNQVKNLFSTDLSKYVVVEVAVYPKDGTTATVQHIDFSMKVGSETVRAAAPDAIVHRKQQASTPQPASPSAISVTPSAGIGYESGPYGHGVYHEEGVAVSGGGMGGPRPPAYPTNYPPDPYASQELIDKALPEGAMSKPVAGYLYFPVSGKKKATYDLEYLAPDGKIRLMLK
jgi:hypothetical protein